MNEASFSNREIAGLVVLGLLVMCVALVLRRRDGEARVAGRGLISSFLHWKILVPVLGFVFWVLAMLLLAARLGIWNASLWKATLLWLLLSGFGLFGKFPDAIDQPKFARRTIAQILGVFLVIEFVANFASFALWIEIPVQMLAFVFGIVAVAAREPEHARIAKLANGYLALLGAYRAVVGGLATRKRMVRYRSLGVGSGVFGADLDDSVCTRIRVRVGHNCRI